jgi:hypothetical protein
MEQKHIKLNKFLMIYNVVVEILQSIQSKINLSISTGLLPLLVFCFDC